MHKSLLFKEQIETFKKSMEEIRVEGIKDNTALKVQLDSLQTLNTNLAKEAQDLTTALKGNNKIQGNFGESKLKNLLEITGLTQYLDYELQVSKEGEDGRSVPDCIINLPEGRKLVIDSKVSLTSYTEYVNEDDEEKRKSAFKKHVKSVNDHINGLSGKEYQNLFKSNSLDYVIMFIPIEQAYIDVLKSDKSFYENAYKQNIAIATDSSLLPILRTVENLWKIQKRSENVDQIAALGGKLYDKVVLFKENMEKIGKSIENASEAHKAAYNQMFSSRKDSILGRAEEMKKLGVNATKTLGAPIDDVFIDDIAVDDVLIDDITIDDVLIDDIAVDDVFIDISEDEKE